MTFSLSSCGPEEPPPNHHIVKMKPKPLAEVPSGSFAANDLPCDPITANCAMIVPNSSVASKYTEEFEKFKFYLDNNKVSEYFSNASNYSALFPEIQENQILLNKLVNGEYKAAMLNKTTIAIYQDVLTDTNVISVVTLGEPTD